MFATLRKLVCLTWLVLASIPTQAAADRFAIISYHDVADVADDDPRQARTSVTTVSLEAQFRWLKQNGYKVISVQEAEDAAANKKPLPDKAVMLVFDDGYASFYTTVFPLLKKYRYPAVSALVGSWMEHRSNLALPFPMGKGWGEGHDNWEDMPPKNELMTWNQVREVARSGLVEIASHSYDLHHGILGNPQGNTQAAAVTRLFEAKARQYEDDAAYRKRLREELALSADFIFQRTGFRPRVMVWPYGEYNDIALDAAREAGLPITMTLRDGINTLADLSALKRLLITRHPTIAEFAEILTKLRSFRPLHVAHLDMDYVYDPDPAQTERNLDAVVKRIQSMKINTVYLQAYTDPDGDGNAEALYFPNRHLPMRADLFNRVAWQLKTRAGVRVYAWMPVMAYKAPLPDDWYVKEWREGKAQAASHIYSRLSPYNDEARRFVGDIYEDLAKHCAFDGLLFHDDGILSDYEDVSPAALAYARDVWGLPGDFDKLHATGDTRLAWAKHKTALLVEFTHYLAERVRYYRPSIKTARNFYTLPLLQPESEEWYAQSFPAFLAGYDYVAIEAMPFMEKAENPDRWLETVVKRAAAYPDGLKKTVFELQSVDWNTQKPVPMEVFLKQIQLLRKQGAIHIGYYPDDVYNDQPRLSAMEAHFTLPGLP